MSLVLARPSLPIGSLFTAFLFTAYRLYAAVDMRCVLQLEPLSTPHSRSGSPRMSPHDPNGLVTSPHGASPMMSPSGRLEIQTSGRRSGLDVAHPEICMSPTKLGAKPLLPRIVSKEAQAACSESPVSPTPPAERRRRGSVAEQMEAAVHRLVLGQTPQQHKSSLVPSNGSSPTQQAPGSPTSGPSPSGPSDRQVYERRQQVNNGMRPQVNTRNLKNIKNSRSNSPAGASGKARCSPDAPSSPVPLPGVSRRGSQADAQMARDLGDTIESPPTRENRSRRGSQPQTVIRPDAQMARDLGDTIESPPTRENRHRRNSKTQTVIRPDAQMARDLGDTIGKAPKRDNRHRRNSKPQTVIRPDAEEAVEDAKRVKRAGVQALRSELAEAQFAEASMRDQLGASEGARTELENRVADLEDQLRATQLRARCVSLRTTIGRWRADGVESAIGAWKAALQASRSPRRSFLQQVAAEQAANSPRSG